MAEYIKTYTGKRFYPTEPKKEDMYIEDIAHALSLLCRGNGHLKHFFSVGQHCVNCALEAEARGYSDRVILACLLHDASECYLSDVPRPFKKTLVGYNEHEEKLLALVYEKFIGPELTKEEQDILKEIDDDMLYFDLRDLLNEPQKAPEPELKRPLALEFQPFEEVEEMYMKIYYEHRIK